MNSQNLEELLSKVKSLLPQPCVEKIEAGMVNTGSLKWLDEFVDNSEFELALDELEALGLLNHCKEDFWKILLLAAQGLALLKHAHRYQQHILACSS